MSDILITALTTLVGIIASYFITKSSLKRKKITNFKVNEYGIGKSLIAEFPELKLTYGNDDISNDLRVYKAVFMNTGHKDIPNAANRNKISVQFPDTCIIRGCNIKKGKVDVNGSISADSKSVILDFGLFQENDCFEYDVIYETTEENVKDIDSQIKFNYRIEDVNNIIDKSGAYFERASFKTKEALIKSIGLIFLVLCVYLISASITTPSHPAFISKTDNKEYVIYEDTDSTYIISENKFIKRLKCNGSVISKPKLERDYITEYREPKNLAYISICFYSLLLLILLAYYYVAYKEVKQVKIIEETLYH